MKKKKFSKGNDIGSKIIAGVVVTLLVVFAFALVFGTVFFGIAGVFKLLGVYYESWYSLLLFVLLYGLIGFIGEFIALPLIGLVKHIFTATYQVFFLTFVIDCSFSLTSIHIADSLMDSINISFGTKCITVVIFFLVEYVLSDNFDNKKDTQMKA